MIPAYDYKIAQKANGPEVSIAASVDPIRPSSSTLQATLGWVAQARAQLEHLQPQIQMASAIQALRRVERHLARPLRYAIMGDANSGKSSLANLLLGIESLPTGVLANTRFPTLLRFGEVPTVAARLTDGQLQSLASSDIDGLGDQLSSLEVTLPSEFLRSCELVDGPGLIGGTHWCRTQLQTIDGVIWCTAATQAWRASEAQAFAALPRRLRLPSVLAMTFADLLGTDERADVRARLTSQAGSLFMSIEEVATRDGLECLRRGDVLSRDDRWAASGALPLRAKIEEMGDAILSDRVARARTLVGRIAERTLQRMN